MLADDLKIAEVRAAALAAKPIAIHSALDRKQSTGPITPTVNRAASEAERSEDDAEQPWMDEEREAAMKAAMEVENAQREAHAAPNRRQAEREDTLDGGPLPALEDMIAQIPAELQEAMDDLFRAKFQSVKRVPQAVLNVSPQTEIQNNRGDSD